MNFKWGQSGRFYMAIKIEVQLQYNYKVAYLKKKHDNTVHISKYFLFFLKSNSGDLVSLMATA